MISIPLIINVISAVTIAIITAFLSKKEKIPRWATIPTLALSIVIIICGMFEALEQSQTDKEILHSITGGDGYCYVEFSATPSKRAFEIYFISVGRYPLYDITDHLLNTLTWRQKERWQL